MTSPVETVAKPLTYADYLEIEALLELQKPRSRGPEHDEMLFIVIHQVYELWFRQLLHEIDWLTGALGAGDEARILATFKRVLTILKTMVSQVDILETMTPKSFSSFRHRLESASGFQSAQFRELEFVLGYKRETVIAHHPKGSPGRLRIDARLDAPTLWDAYIRFLTARGVAVPRAITRRDVRRPVEPCPEFHPVLLEVYLDDHIAAMISERMVDLDEGIQEWRYRHVKMVERTIGSKTGTGGSEGTAYLRGTLFRPLFPDLWAIRSSL